MKWYTDIRLDDDWQLTQATNGDAPIVMDVDAFMQDVRLESLTQEGELFYDKDYGWGLMDFLQGSDDETTMLEIRERVRSRLARRKEVDVESIETYSQFTEDSLVIQTRFRINGVEEQQVLEVSLSRIRTEVVTE